MDDLLKFYQPDGPERVGFILTSGEVIEVKNISETPETSFKVSLEDLQEFASKATSTWHTHPGGHKNLSMADFRTFSMWPALSHYIVGNDGVRKYWTENDDLISD